MPQLKHGRAHREALKDFLFRHRFFQQQLNGVFQRRQLLKKGGGSRWGIFMAAPELLC